MRERGSSNGLANFIMLVGFALLVMGGISAYPSLRSALGGDEVPQGFGDEAALGAGILEVGESLPPGASTSAGSPPAVLPETPLESEATPEPPPTLEPTLVPTQPLPTPTAVVESTLAPTATPIASEFVPGVPTRLVIPAIELDAPVETVGWGVTVQNGQQVSMWDVPNRRAAGWLKTTARPGEPGNTVLDGHHNISGEVFRDLNLLTAGDTIQVWAGDRPRDYVVSLLKILPEKGQSIEVRLDNAKWIQPTKDERLTLVTCWPYTNNTHRLIVVALPTDAPPSGSGAE